MATIIFTTKGITDPFSTLIVDKEDFEAYKSSITRKPNHCTSMKVEEAHITFDFQGSVGTNRNSFRNKLIKHFNIEV